MADKDLIRIALKTVWPVRKNSKKIDVSAYNDSNVLTPREDVVSASIGDGENKESTLIFNNGAKYLGTLSEDGLANGRGELTWFKSGFKSTQEKPVFTYRHKIGGCEIETTVRHISWTGNWADGYLKEGSYSYSDGIVTVDFDGTFIGGRTSPLNGKSKIVMKKMGKLMGKYAPLNEDYTSSFDLIMNIESGKMIGGKGTIIKVASVHSYNVYNGDVSAVGMPHGSGVMKTLNRDDDTLIAHYDGEFKDGKPLPNGSTKSYKWDDDDELVPESVPLEPPGASPQRYEEDSDKNGVDPLARESPESAQSDPKGPDPSTAGSSPSTISSEGNNVGPDPSTGGSTTSDVSSNGDNRQEGSPGSLSLGGLSTNNGGLSDSFQLDAAAAAAAATAADAEDDDDADDYAEDENDNLSRPNSTPDSAEIHPQIQTPLDKFRSLAISTTKNAASSVASNAPVLASSAANLAGKFANATLDAAKGVYAATLDSSDEENQFWGPFAHTNNGNVDDGGDEDDDDDDDTF